jgi:hypothetical protein
MANTVNNQLLSEAVQHSQLLLSYIAEHGIDISEDQINILTKAKQLNSENKWTPEEEAKFWHTYQKMVKLIQPVTINSLLATIEQPINSPTLWQKLIKQKIKPALAHSAVKLYTTFALLSMAVMLILQIYSVIGTTLLKSIEKASIRMKEIEVQVSDLSLIDKSTNKRTSLQIGILQSEFEELENEKNSSIKLLESWHNLEFLRFRKDTPETQIEQGGIASGDMMMMPGQNPAYMERVDVLQSANNTNLILNIYILPLLYGLLGGFAFVLRNLTTEIEKMLFSHESRINYTLRINLGALLGLIVGLFWGDRSELSQSFIANLSPLAVAFLAGYSVEFIFKLFDNIISTILKTNLKQEDSKK